MSRWHGPTSPMQELIFCRTPRRLSRIRPKPSSRLWPLIAITIRVVALGLATVGLLKSLCGSWTSVLLLRRRLLSVMDLIFAASSGPDPEVVIRLSLELKKVRCGAWSA